MSILDHLTAPWRSAVQATEHPVIILSRIPPEEPSWQTQEDNLREALLAGNHDPLLMNSIYDSYEEDAEILGLREIKSDIIFLGWQYPRALKWILARQNIEVNGETRKLHCIDIRDQKPATVVAEVTAILAGKTSAVVSRPPTSDAPADGLTPKERGERAEATLPNPENAERSPRWYPVVDYDMCTHCMECLDFCLFGVYGVDHAESLRVVQQDECRTDCPACSRVCPAGAIIFPKYKTNQAIAGGDEEEAPGPLKLDLSKIFGKPKARHMAALERDRELLKAGRTPASVENVERLSEEFDKAEI